MLTSQRSPRKSVQEYVSSVDDFVAPFENFLEESIMEEDFMLNDIDFSDDENDSEELKQDFIDEGKYKISCRIVVRVLTQGPRKDGCHGCLAPVTFFGMGATGARFQQFFSIFSSKFTIL